LTYLIHDQYMVGSDILVAPVIKDGMRTRGIYLPAGAEWIDWWTGEKYESGKTHYPQTPLDRLPLFIRVGAIVPTQSVIQHTGEMPNAEITLNVAAGMKPEVIETGKLFQDAGDGYGYRANDWSEFVATHKAGSITFKRNGSFRGQRITKMVVHGVTARPSAINVDGKPVEFQFNAELKRLEYAITGSEQEIRLVR
jgi:alpha-glucosidase (family GH31 glycosyl hydrolase)